MEIVVPDGYQHLYEVSPTRPIIKVPAAVLRDKAKPVGKITQRHRLLADNMTRIMRQANGVGLAGPQIGVLERVVVISPDGRPMALFNPEIIEKEGTVVGEEGCLSIPGLYGDVTRAAVVKVKATTKRGDEVVLTLKDLGARVIQHEIDHLDGILFTDKVDIATLYWRIPDGEEKP